MNPATDVGKRSLTDGVRNRFTEIFVDEPIDYHDISTIVSFYLNKRGVSICTVIGKYNINSSLSSEFSSRRSHRQFCRAKNSLLIGLIVFVSRLNYLASQCGPNDWFGFFCNIAFLNAYALSGRPVPL